MALIVPLDPAATPAVYATLTDARAVGATGTDADVTAALTAASSRVDRITRWWWAPRAARVTGFTGPDGLLVLPRPAVTIDSVTVSGTLQPTTSWQLEGTSLGARLLLNLRATGAFDQLATVVPRSSVPVPSRIEVVGTFGETVTPLEVTRATALIAAALTPGSTATAVNVEGDTDVPPRAGQPTANLGTGVAAADELLRPYLRNRVKVA